MNQFFYYRYVDDPCSAIHKQFIPLLLDTFNTYDSNLKFTHQLEKNNSLNFLDITLFKYNNSLTTNGIQKPMSLNRLLNFNSNHNLQFKKNIIYNFVDRAILLSDRKFHNKNLNTVRKILHENKNTLRHSLTKISKNI